MKRSLLCFAALVCLLKATAQPIPWNQYHPEPYAPGAGWTNLPVGDDVSHRVQLPFTFDFFGQPFTDLYINENGNVSFGRLFDTWTPSAFPVPNAPAIIAPFWADVNTTLAVPDPNINKIRYKIYPDRIVVFWDSVRGHNAYTDLYNKFQLVLYNNTVPVHRYNYDFDVRFTYDTLMWLQGTTSGGTLAQQGWMTATGVTPANTFNMPGARTATPLGWPGRKSFAYQFNNLRSIQIAPPIPAAPAIRYPDTIFYRPGVNIAPVFVTNTGGTVPSLAYGSVRTHAGSSMGMLNDMDVLRARFKLPVGLAIDRAGNIYVGDCGNGVVRRISNTGGVTTHFSNALDTASRALATSITGQVYRAHGKAGLAQGMNMYGTIPGYAYNNVTGIAVDSAGNVYLADRGMNCIHFSTPSGNLTTINMGFMNPRYAGTGVAGRTNGPAATATFNQPAGVALDKDGNLYVADLGNNQIRKITKAGMVSLFAGSATGIAGTANGTTTDARFNKPFGIAADRQGNVYVTDSGSHTIRKITPAGVVTTLAGSGTAGMLDHSIATTAQFNGPAGIAVDNYGNVLVSDAGNHRIRVIATNGYHITPALPNGMGFEANTGIIYGSPVGQLTTTTHTITAYNQSGSSSRTIVIAPDPIVLPITLGAIDAINKGAVNEIRWNSVSEAAGDAFQVERSGDGSHFATLGTVTGKAVNGGSYTYADQRPLTGINYYRLQLLNKDGSTGYSKIVSAVKKNEGGVQVYPNPVRAELTIKVNGITGKNATVAIYDLNGKLLISNRFTGQQLTVSMNALPAGIYSVHYQDELRREVFSIVKE